MMSMSRGPLAHETRTKRVEERLPEVRAAQEVRVKVDSKVCQLAVVGHGPEDLETSRRLQVLPVDHGEHGRRRVEADEQDNDGRH